MRSRCPPLALLLPLILSHNSAPSPITHPHPVRTAVSTETKASTIHKLEELGYEVDSEYAVYAKGEMPSGAKHHRDSSGGSGSGTPADADTSTSTTGSGLTDEEKHEHRGWSTVHA